MPLKRKRLAVPVPLKRWFENQYDQPMREIVNSDVFQQAAATLKESIAPSLNGVSSEPQVNSQRHAYHAGYHDALRDLTKLAHQPVTQKELPPEWSHILPEEN